MENPKGSGDCRLFHGVNMNGVKPIKETFMTYLAARNLQDEYSVDVGVSITGPAPIDAVKISNNDIFVFKWEIGNIASSHRTLYRISTGILRLIGGVLILPSREMYTHLTDRVKLS
ncbi:PDDEXK family nuclease [Bacillus amyloliquefaciens]